MNQKKNSIFDSLYELLAGSSVSDETIISSFCSICREDAKCLARKFATRVISMNKSLDTDNLSAFDFCLIAKNAELLITDLKENDYFKEDIVLLKDILKYSSSLNEMMKSQPNYSGENSRSYVKLFQEEQKVRKPLRRLYCGLLCPFIRNDKFFNTTVTQSNL